MLQKISFIGIDLVLMARQELDNGGLSGGGRLPIETACLTRLLAHFECYDISASGLSQPNRRDVGAIHARCLSFGLVESSYRRKTANLDVIFAATVVVLMAYFETRIVF